MKFKKIICSLMLGGCLALAGAGCSFKNTNNNPNNSVQKQEVTIANWNLQIFGKEKAENKETMDAYVSAITNWDIIFVQEIRDSSDSAFGKLCSRLDGYEHLISSRAGRTNSKEQYGIFYRKGIKAEKFTDFNPALSNKFERPPVESDFVIGSYTARVYNIHTKPTDTPSELKELEKIVTTQGNVIILGDLNASGSYYHHSKEKQFLGWHWIIGDKEDTTVAKSTNAYDRIIMNNDAFNEYESYGVYTNLKRKISDHYPVFVRIIAKER